MQSATLDQIDRDAVRSLLAPERGVNLLDLERLALSVPGTRVRRARAWASLHPAYPCLDAPGIVTLVVVPEAPAHMPAPSPGLLNAVWRYLNRRRMVCTVLQVTGPEYVEISITATVQSRAGAGSANIMQRIEAALQNFLDPLAGGPDSLGWPFGRSVFRSEILQLIQNIPGVDHVVTLSMQAGTGGAQCGDIALCPMALTRSGLHQVEVL
jgi:predicted phage baseplate assembly protein